MTFFAKIEDDIVVNIIVAEQDFIDSQSGQYVKTTLKDNCQRFGTFKNGKFITIKPHKDYILSNGKWEPPVPRPLTDSQLYVLKDGKWKVNTRKDFKYNYTKHKWEKIGN